MAISGGDGSIILQTKVDTSGVKKGFSQIKSLGATAAKTFAVISAAAATAAVAITKSAVSAYADYEQLVGGVETLFKGSAGKVVEYAQQAFYTAGVSANEYMRQVTSFSASLIRSTAGDTDKAVDVANMALIDISDNVNKMGSSMESVTMAYQGFAKQQYMLLDNLKLGYGGTKTEMERLLKDAQALTGQKYDISNLADVYQAIHAIQEELGIAGTTAKEAETTIAGSANMMKAAWENVVTSIAGGGSIDNAINSFVYSVARYFDNIVPVVQRSLVGIGQLIQQIAPMLVQNIASALIQAIPNLVVAVYQMIVGLAKGIWAGIKALFTGKGGVVSNVKSGIKSSVGGISSGGGGVSPSGTGGGGGGKKGKSAEEQEIEAEEKAINDKIKALQKENKQIQKNDKANRKANQKQLASFDDLNTLGSAQTSEADEMIDKNNEEIDQLREQLDLLQEKKQALQDAASAAGGGAGGGGIEMPSIGAGGGGGLFEGIGSEISDQINEQLTAIMAIAGASLLAIGLLLLFLGHIAWGVGFIIAGAITFAVAAANSGKFNVATEVIGVLTTIMGVAGGALLALGIILLYVGGVVSKGLAIGMIIAGASLIVSAVATKAAFTPNDIKGWLSTITGIAAGALLALGVILCMVGSTPLGVGLIIAGVVSLASAVALNYTVVTDKIKGWVAVIMGIAGGALLVLGIVLCVAGVSLPLGIALIAVGALALATPVALNWDTIKEKATTAFNAVFNWVKTWGLLVLGIILAISGVGLPLGIALMKQGGANLTEAQDPLWNTIVDKVKEVWGNIKDFWNNNIKKYFTAQWWKDLGTGAINGLVRAVVNGLNKLIGRVNSFGFDLPDILGGKHIGFHIPSIPMPALARGAVLPGGKAFAAIVNDQPYGQTNIEAPLQTIVDAFNIATQNNQNGNGNIEVTLVLDGREFGRAVVEQGNRESRRIGTRLVVV